MSEPIKPIKDDYKFQKDYLNALREYKQAKVDLATYFYATFNNATKKGSSHGSHRRPSPKTHRDPSQGTDPSTRRAGALHTAHWAALTHTILSLPSAAFAHPTPGIPHAGIRTGEIIAYRAWEYKYGSLHSLIADYEWLPGKVATGDINQVVQVSLTACLYGGIYAFKDFTGGDLLYRAAQPDRYIVGEVALWGEVIEHEHGYRAQFARITDFLHYHTDYEHIINRYREAFQ